VAPNQEIVNCGVLTKIGQTAEDSSGHSDTEPKEITLDILTDCGVILEDSTEHSVTEPTNGAVRDIDRYWTDCRRQHWT
jgi:hypothetical protein